MNVLAIFRSASTRQAAASRDLEALSFEALSELVQQQGGRVKGVETWLGGIYRAHLEFGHYADLRIEIWGDGDTPVRALRAAVGKMRTVINANGGPGS